MSEMRQFSYTFGCILSTVSLLTCSQPVDQTPSSTSERLSLVDTQEVWFYTLEEAMKQPKEVKHLSLRERNFETFPTEILTFENLERLDIAMNLFTTLPDSIGKLKKLTRLSCAYGYLTHLPGSIGDLENLESLVLLDNKLTSLPPEIGNLKKLRRLNLALNPIQFELLPEELFNLSKLEELAFEDTFHRPIFSEEERQKIRQRLPNCMLYFGENDE